VWPFGIILVLPCSDLCVCILEREEPMLVEALLTEPGVKGFDECIV